jgi:homopolymeric O-antigen transport system ATP-binding protein
MQVMQQIANSTPTILRHEISVVEPTKGSDLALRVEQLGKCYQLYRKPRHRLKQALFGRWRRYHRDVWALRDVSFDVAAGQTIGLIGANGSGKSTLLQIVAGTLTPTEGRVLVHGRVSALLELGSGFNPEFSGRENVYVYGSILGLTQQQMDERFDAVAGFADIGEYMDCPLKTYSSGMIVRLAFSVAISVDPDILLVDEALAVGDIRFQQRCMTRIRQLRDRGVSILFVTHDLEAAKRLCDQLHILEHGRLIRSGDPEAMANWYLGHMTDEPEKSLRRSGSLAARTSESFRHGDGQGEILSVALLTMDGRPAERARMDELHRVRFELLFHTAVESAILGFYLRDRMGTDVIGVNTYQEKAHLPEVQPGDRVTVDFVLPFRLRPGPYSVNPGLAYNQHEMRYMDWINHALVFEIVDPQPGRTVFGLTHPEVTVETTVHAAELTSVEEPA